MLHMQKLNIKPEVNNTFKGLNMKFNTRVNGIPCICNVIFYEEKTKFTEGEFEFYLLDRKGYVAHWLNVYVDATTEERLLKEYLEQ